MPNAENSIKRKINLFELWKRIQLHAANDFQGQLKITPDTKMTKWRISRFSAVGFEKFFCGQM